MEPTTNQQKVVIDHRGICYSQHAERRRQQRGINLEAVEAALDYGDPVWAGGGCTAFFLGKRAVRSAARKGLGLETYEGTTVVYSACAVVVTVWRSDKAPRPGLKHYPQATGRAA